MYFSIVLLLLLTPKFTYSMNTRVQTAPQQRTGNDQGTELLELRLRNEPEEELFPFIHPYTEETKKFIKIITKYFSITITGKMKLGITFLVRFKKEDRTCKFNFKMNYIDYEMIPIKNIRIIFTANDR